MNDIILEIIRAVVLLFLLIYLSKSAKKYPLISETKGWKLIFTGFVLLLLGTILDISDNFENLNYLIVVGDTEVEAFLEKIGGYLGGFILIFLGFIYWLPEMAEIKNMEEEINCMKEYEIELEKARNNALEIAKAKSDFLAAMSHEIRTPLTSLIGASDILNDTKLDKEQMEYNRIIKSSGQSLYSLVNDILDFSKIEGGKVSLENNDFILSDAIDSTCKIIKILSEKKGLKFNCNIDKGVPNIICGDFTRLNQILINIVGNAVKFTEAGSVSLSIENIKDDTIPNSEVKLLFQVKDTGIGIEKSKQDYIFEHFTQEDYSTKREYGGTGLGLAISKKLLMLMGGSIEVESEKGQGSTFNFTALFEKKRQEHIIIKKEEVGREITSKKNIKILLVDDSEEIRNIILEYLKKMSCEIDTAENGYIALNMYKKNDYDIVLMDMEMPVMDGYTSTENIRTYEDSNGLKRRTIIALTAHALKEHTEKIIKAGCDLHITKPIRKEVILEVINRY